MLASFSFISLASREETELVLGISASGETGSVLVVEVDGVEEGAELSGNGGGSLPGAVGGLMGKFSMLLVGGCSGVGMASVGGVGVSVELGN